MGGHSSSTQKATGQTSANWVFGKKAQKKFSINRVQLQEEEEEVGTFIYVLDPVAYIFPGVPFSKGKI